MARRNGSIFDALERLPWWISVALAVIAYPALKYYVPTLEFHKEGPLDMEHAFYKEIANFAPALAPAIALLLLGSALLSAINSLRKRKRLDRQKSFETIRQLKWKEFEELVGEAYRRKGYAVSENASAGPDGGSSRSSA